MTTNPDPSCPRCGYDLSGQITVWNHADSNQCPLTGLCSECGLDFAWVDIFDPFRNRIRDFIEHTDQGISRAAWHTWRLAIRPSKFWSLVRIEFEPRTWRALLWLILVVGVVWAIGPLACNASSIWLWLRASRPVPLQALALLEPWGFGIIGEKFSRGSWGFGLTLNEIPAFISGPLAAAVTIPIVLLALPDTRNLAKVRAILVIRAAVYSLAWLPPVLILKALYQIQEATRWHLWPPSARTLSSTIRMFDDRVNMACRFIHGTWILWFGLILAWLFAWWWFALRVGWRLQDYNKVMRALVIPALLAAAIAIALSDDGYRLFM